MAHRTDLNTIPLVCFVKVGGKPIAASFNLVGPKSLEFFITTYDRAFHPYSPGILLLAYVAQWACENGRDFDMRYLHVDYKAHWANYTVLCRRHAVFLARGNAAAAVSLAGLAVGRIFASFRRRLSAIPWRPGGASGRRFAEDEREVVGRHRERFGKFKAMLGGKVRHLVQAAQPPSRIARLQARIESEVGGRGLDARLDIGAVEEENTAGRQQAAGLAISPWVADQGEKWIMLMLTIASARATGHVSGAAASSRSGGSRFGKAAWVRQASMLASASGEGLVGCHCRPGRAAAL